MKISYTWLKSYVPDLLGAGKLRDIFTYHLCEVEGIENKANGKDSETIFDINILPNRAHDLLCHRGIAYELAGLLGLEYKNIEYKIPEAKPTNLKVDVQSDACRRYMARIIRGVKVTSSSTWVVEHLEAIGQRSINSIVDATNLVMFDRGNPIHAFDLKKLASSNIIIRQAKEGEEITTLGRDQIKAKLDPSMMVIADESNVLALAGIKGGKKAEVDEHTTDLIIEVANFDPIAVRKTSRKTGIRTDSSKRFENDFPSELARVTMNDVTALIAEMNPGCTIEEVVDIYPKKQEKQTLSFSREKISKILGVEVSDKQMEDILKRYHFQYTNNNDMFEIKIPSTRLDLVIEEDMAEEVGRILGYDKVKSKIPKIDFKPKVNETYAKISWARNKLLSEGYSEVMTYTFAGSGEVEVLESASDKKFLRTNLVDGLKESLKLNKVNAPLLDTKEVKIFEIGTVFKKDKEEINVAYNEKEKIIEKSLEEFCKDASPDTFAQVLGSPRVELGESTSQKHTGSAFAMWSLFPFIARDIAVWVPEDVSSEDVEKVIKSDMGELVVKGPELFDQFKKDGKISYAFRLVFQSFERTLTDTEINQIMTNIANKIKDKNGWQVR